MPLSFASCLDGASPRLSVILRLPELRAIEHRHAKAPLMERAGLAAAEVARSMLANRSGPVVILAGPGNNGGDAFVTARLLRSWFHDVVVVFRGQQQRLPADARAAHAAYVDSGGGTTYDLPQGRTALIVDGLIGIGLRRPPASEHAELIEWANRTDAPVLALDAPSGVHAETGAAFAPAIRADATATFLALKPGLLTGDGVDLCGAISVHLLGVEIDESSDSAGRRLEWRALSAALPSALRRARRNVHKGTFGTLAIVADALNLIAKHPTLRTAVQSRQAPTLATPHPAEAARLLATDIAHVESDRLASATTLARELNASVVLKGAGSVLAYPDGGFDINASGSPALATAGTGDVLAGLVGAFVAQRLDPKTALRYAVCLHGAAADALVAGGIGPVGLVASELADSARTLIAAAASRERLGPLG